MSQEVGINLSTHRCVCVLTCVCLSARGCGCICVCVAGPLCRGPESNTTWQIYDGVKLPFNGRNCERGVCVMARRE